MKNYNSIRKTCQESSRISRSVLDNFLLNYVEEREKPGPEIKKRFSPYWHVISEFPHESGNFLITQYLAHQIFKAGGLIKKLLNHSAVKNRDKEELAYLTHQSKHPWRYSFSVITGNPEKDLYEMKDVFTGDEYLLFSPGTTAINSEKPISMWFNLIAYNGACWETYGPIAAYQSFEPEDLFYFAEQLHPHKFFDSGEEILEDVERNPVPYMLLLSGSQMPATFHKDHQVVECMAEYDAGNFVPRNLESRFRIEYNEGVYKLSSNDQWSEFPHFDTLYYDEKEELLFLYAMTDKGFEQLVKLLNSQGFDFDVIPFYRVNLSMQETTKNLLRKKTGLNPYEKLFAKNSSPEEQEEVDKLNRLMKKVLPSINAGETPDIEALAKETGVEPEVARDIMNDLLNKIGR